MSKWMYYSVHSKSKEHVGTIEATSEEEAYNIASGIKQLPVEKFKELFKVEPFTYGK
tara:strand:+ start:1150 stop:1320 length:171 start_codon:yes stop_codon:yes gene_type:complete